MNLLPLEDLPTNVLVTRAQIKDSVPNSCSRCAISQTFQKELDIFHPDTVQVTYLHIYFRVQDQERYVKLGYALQGWLRNYEADPSTAPRIRLSLRTDLIEEGFLYYEIKD